MMNRIVYPFYTLSIFIAMLTTFWLTDGFILEGRGVYNLMMQLDASYTIDECSIM